MVRLMLILAFGLMVARGATTENLTVLKEQSADGPPKEMMARYLNGLAEEALVQRREVYEQVKTAEDCAAYQQRLRDFYVEQLGGWPERTPLNARVVGERAFEDYRIEKVVYESRPNFFVTAILHLPLGEPPYPGVLVPCGHSANGKACEAYQRACILLAKHGIAALIYDPIAQGERHQHLLDSGKPAVGSSTIEHTLTGVGAILVGMNTASFRIWDGMRGIDYLVEREDVDAERIGCTGNSGGGTLTSYIMALDPRVKAAAPSCYLTSFERILHTCGPQDAEQNICGQIAFGMNHADYVIMRAPKPTLMCCATHDFFDITGAWDSFRQAKRIYTRLGFSERVDLVEADEKHGFSKPLREAMVHWMQRWLLGVDEPVTELDFPVLSDEEALCTPQGQVMLLDNARSVWDILADREAELAEKRSAFWANTPHEEALQKVREVVGIRPLDELPEPEIVGAGSVERDGYRIEKLVLKPEPGISLPALLFVRGQAETPLSDAYLYLHGKGKDVDAALGGAIEGLVKDGHVVLAVDLRGVGETECEARHKGWTPFFGTDWQDYFRAYLLGRSYVGMRAEDVLVCARFLAQYKAGDTPNRVRLIAIGEAAVPALHAAALEPGLFDSIQLDRMVTSWADTVRIPLTNNQLINAVHNALAAYDLPDLVKALSKDRLMLTNPMTPSGKASEGKG